MFESSENSISQFVDGLRLVTFRGIFVANFKSSGVFRLNVQCRCQTRSTRGLFLRFFGIFYGAALGNVFDSLECIPGSFLDVSLDEGGCKPVDSWKVDDPQSDKFLSIFPERFQSKKFDSLRQTLEILNFNFSSRSQDNLLFYTVIAKILVDFTIDDVSLFGEIFNLSGAPPVIWFIVEIRDNVPDSIDGSINFDRFLDFRHLVFVDQGIVAIRKTLCL